MPSSFIRSLMLNLLLLSTIKDKKEDRANNAVKGSLQLNPEPGLGLHSKKHQAGGAEPLQSSRGQRPEYLVVKASNFTAFSVFYAHTQCHSQLNVCARTAEMTKLTIHQPSALCQLNQHEAAKITVHCPLSAARCLKVPEQQ